MDDPKRILVIMDGLKEFSVDLLEWALKNFTFGDCCSITLLDIMPWLNIPSKLSILNNNEIIKIEKHMIKSDSLSIHQSVAIVLCGAVSSKTRSDIWSMELEDLSSFQEKIEFKNDAKYQILQCLIDLCR